MTYSEHLVNALCYSFKALSAGIIIAFHGLFPDYCVYTGSTIIRELNSELQKNKVTVS